MSDLLPRSTRYADFLEKSEAAMAEYGAQTEGGPQAVIDPEKQFSRLIFARLQRTRDNYQSVLENGYHHKILYINSEQSSRERYAAGVALRLFLEEQGLIEAFYDNLAYSPFGGHQEHLSESDQEIWCVELTHPLAPVRLNYKYAPGEETEEGRGWEFALLAINRRFTNPPILPPDAVFRLQAMNGQTPSS